MWVKKQQLEPDIEQLIGSKLKKEYNKAVHCHPAYLAYMQSVCVCVCVTQSCLTLAYTCEMLGWMNHKLE